MNDRGQDLEALRAAALALITEADLAAVLQKVVDSSRELVGARYAALAVLDERGTAIEQFIIAGLTPAERAALGPLPRGRGLLGVILREQRSLRIAHIAEDSRSAGFPPHHPPMRSLLGVPILSKGRVFGNLYLTDKIVADTADGVGEFTAGDQELVEHFAMMAAVAVENAMLRRRSEELALVRERERIAMELHDGAIQSIYAVGLLLDDCRYRFEADPDGARSGIDEAIRGLNDVIVDLRRYIMGLEPLRFRGRDLESGLQALAREVRAASFLAVRVEIDPEAAALADDEQTRAFLRVAQEALANVRKHAAATAVVLRLSRRDDSLELCIEDNGVGFDVQHGRRGSGLRNIEGRAAALGGRLILDSDPGQGVRLTVLAPSARGLA